MTEDMRPDQAPMRTVALLDGADQLIGFDRVPTDAPLSDHQIPAPDDCDLKPGLYWYDRELRKFEPLKRPLQGEQNLTAVAIADFMRALAQHTGCPLPDSTRQWLAILERDQAHRARA